VTKATETKTNDPQEPQRRSRRKIVVVVACVAMVATAVALNHDRLWPDVSSTSAQSPEASGVENTAPLVVGVTPSTERIAPLDACQMVCEATDADGDPLSFMWEASQGEIVGEGSTVEWVAPEAEGLFRVSVTVEDGNGGNAEYSTSVRVKQNRAPEFQSMSSIAEWVTPGSSTYMAFSAQDPDGDEVTYEWDANAGELFGQGDSVVWLAPEEAGSYRVAVVARDAYGGEATREIPIGVMLDAAPVLGEFVVEAIGHTLLSFNVGVWDIFRGRSCSIECAVLDGSAPYTYEWTADEGKLTADGAVARWDAPDRKGPATITVAVTDTNGKTTTGSVLMYVETCTCHFD